MLPDAFVGLSRTSRSRKAPTTPNTRGMSSRVRSLGRCPRPVVADHPRASRRSWSRGFSLGSPVRFANQRGAEREGVTEGEGATEGEVATEGNQARVDVKNNMQKYYATD